MSDKLSWSVDNESVYTTGALSRNSNSQKSELAQANKSKTKNGGSVKKTPKPSRFTQKPQKFKSDLRDSEGNNSLKNQRQKRNMLDQLLFEEAGGAVLDFSQYPQKEQTKQTFVNDPRLAPHFEQEYLEDSNQTLAQNDLYHGLKQP